MSHWSRPTQAWGAGWLRTHGASIQQPNGHAVPITFDGGGRWIRTPQFATRRPVPTEDRSGGGPCSVARSVIAFYTHPDPKRPAFSNSFALLFRGARW
jgi:hypothetical protein